MQIASRLAARPVRLAAVLVPLAMAGLGCKDMMKSDKDDGKMTAPTASAPMEMKGATHTLTKAMPYYTSMPSAGAASAGMLKEGTPVKVMVPGATYSKVEIGNGTSVYVDTDSLKPM